MSNNFGELQKAIQDGQISNVQLLSITLDPEFDTPQILKEYGASRHADPNVWTFATGKVDSLLQAFSVYRQTENGTISHGLATVLVSPDGKIVTIWRGNGWTPAEVIQAIRGEKTPATVNR
jgi:protein SCO1/2